MKVLGIVLARSGSKRVKNKNLKTLNDKSLFQRLYESTKDCDFIERIIVSTDSTKIAEEAKKFKFEIPFIRPKQLSADDSSSYDSIIHCIDWLKKNDGYDFDALLNLQLTSPFRETKTLIKAYSIFKKNLKNGFDSLVTLKKISDDLLANKYLVLNKNSVVSKFDQIDLNKKKFYVRDGNINPLVLKKSLINNHDLYGKKCFGLISDSEIESIDLNTDFDFKLSESLIRGNIVK